MSPTVRGHRRKDRRTWCRGKVGVEHTLAVGSLRNHYSYGKSCGWWRWSHDDESPWPAWPGGCCSYWQCYEQEYCSRCGKVMADSLGSRCTQRWVTPQLIVRTW